MRRGGHRVPHQPEDPDRAALKLRIAVDAREPEEEIRQNRVARRRGVIVEALLPRDQPLAVGGGEEEAAALGVGEKLDCKPPEPGGLLEPPQLAAGDVELVEAVRDIGVVLEETRVLRGALAVRPEESPALVGERPEQE